MTQRERMDSLEPGFREKVEQLLIRAHEATGRIWILTDARRTLKQQYVLYAQGRTAPGKVVTKARAGSSAHNFGLAADLAPYKDGTREVDWEAPKPIWKAMADEAQKLGLVAGFYFKSIYDAPHVEDANWKASQAAWKAGKLKVA